MKAPETAILYDSLVDIHFADIDAYGHVNSKHFLDYVTSSRFKFAAEALGLTPRLLVEKQIGFFLVRAETDFLSPIMGVHQVRVKSYTEISGKKISIPFEIRSPDDSALYAKGIVQSLFVDLKTQRACECPEWLKPYFLKSSV